MKQIVSAILAIPLLISTFQAGAQNKKAYSFDNLPVIAKTFFKKDTINILKYGAKNDGITLNTKSINQAITDCNKRGGGVVVIPEGLWLTGPIELKSNVNLHLKKNALLQFTKDMDQYPLVEGNWEGLPQMRNQSPIWASNQQNIAITGYGIVDGGGEAWRMVKKDKLTESQWKSLLASGGVVGEDNKSWYPSAKSLKGAKMKNAGVITKDKDAAFYAEIKDFLRPNLLVLNRCKRVLLEGVTFQNSPAWNLHPLMSEDITIRNVYAKNPWYAQNGDGLDIESCKNVLVEGSTFDVGDDGICIKSGRDAEGRKRAMPTENVVIRHSTVYHAHGGFVIGSEMSGGAKNIFISDCTFIGTDIGLRFKTTRGRGGVVENIYARNINMKDIPGEAILFDMYYAAVDPVPLTGEKRETPKVELLPVTEETPVFRKFYISNVVCDGAAKAVFIRGLPEMSISDIFLDNLTIKAKEGLDIQEAKNISLSNVHLDIKNAKPLIYIQNGSSVTLSNISYTNAELLFRINGAKNSNIKLTGTATSKAAVKTEFGHGAQADVLEIK
ncbi:glycoside hydrolase family 28 protein [Pedobacter heparinus]|uniref:Glycoside hydrolase family 28 n=1 Tax=Pedobacter heparinus (strain ATCC 13125 / DSM 2366 / CIP 104194 / JCM 7457 / NBRC 12017 / NCIMB 9290 / NRRL B-14731 / HIM 762-3) TaxID=485917 RepID=C6Y3U7_PEDHD|nr:glycoside hydrolase family 28 protein [Pedobacter heparinus]ACU03376.1 glycoside hydrolase family 28 [Pedobacter heparinus DSM 2366]